MVYQPGYDTNQEMVYQPGYDTNKGMEYQLVYETPWALAEHLKGEHYNTFIMDVEKKKKNIFSFFYSLDN